MVLPKYLLTVSVFAAREGSCCYCSYRIIIRIVRMGDAERYLPGDEEQSYFCFTFLLGQLQFSLFSS